MNHQFGTHSRHLVENVANGVTVSNSSQQYFIRCFKFSNFNVDFMSQSVILVYISTGRSMPFHWNLFLFGNKHFFDRFKSILASTTKKQKCTHFIKFRKSQCKQYNPVNQMMHLYIKSVGLHCTFFYWLGNFI